MHWSFAVLLMIGCGGGGHKGGDGGPGSDGSGMPGDGMPDSDGSLSCSGVSTTVPALQAKTIVTGLTKPVFVTHPPGSTDLYVVEKLGTIHIVRAGAIVPAAFLDVTAEVNIPDPVNSEGGLLGLAFNADYAQSGRFFVYLSVKASSTEPDRMTVREYHRSTTNPDLADPATMSELLFIPNGGYNELGGTVLFGPDGKLWVGTGDAAATPSPSPDVTSRLGKMLRLDVDHPGTPPTDNLGGSADPYVWDFGLRNPYRFSVDRATNAIYIADAGDQLFEEVNIELPAPAGGHADYGWDRYEGDVCHDGSASCGATGTLPQYVRAHDTSFSVIIGGNVYRGNALPALRGRYIFAIFAQAGRVLSFVYCGGQVTSQVELTNSFTDTSSISGFGEDVAGELYFVTLGGALYEIVPG